MSKLRPDSSQRDLLVLKTLESHGELTIQEIADATKLSYWQARRSLETLKAEDKIFVSNIEDKKLYFSSKHSVALPTFNTGNGQRSSLHDLAKYIAEQGMMVKHDELNTAINRAIAATYAQPILAETKNAIDNDELTETSIELQKVIRRLEKILNTVRELHTRAFSKQVDTYRNWYGDKRYNPELAYKLHQAWCPSSVVLDEPAAELGLGNSPSKKIKMTPKQKEIHDQIYGK